MDKVGRLRNRVETFATLFCTLGIVPVLAKNRSCPPPGIPPPPYTKHVLICSWLVQFSIKTRLSYLCRYVCYVFIYFGSYYFGKHFTVVCMLSLDILRFSINNSHHQEDPLFQLQCYMQHWYIFIFNNHSTLSKHCLNMSEAGHTELHPVQPWQVLGAEIQIIFGTV